MPKLCRVFRPPATDACGLPARYVVTFGDGDQTKTCGDCALYLRSVAQGHGTNVSIKKLSENDTH